MANAGQIASRLQKFLGKEAARGNQQGHADPDSAPSANFAALMPQERTISVWGPAGAPGKSTLALNLADSLAFAGQRTLLIDSDLVAPSLALMVGAADQATGLSAACKLAREANLDPAELHRVSIKVDAAGPSFWLLPGISGASRWPEITPSAIETILRAASRDFDVAIFDLASSLEPALRTDAAALARNELTRYLVSNVDRLICLAQPDAVSVHRMLRQLPDLQRLRADAALTLVINRVRQSVNGSKPERQLSETFNSLVKINPAFFLPDDPATCDSALRGGVPVRLIKRRSTFAVAVRALALYLRV